MLLPTNYKRCETKTNVRVLRHFKHRQQLAISQVKKLEKLTVCTVKTTTATRNVISSKAELIYPLKTCQSTLTQQCSLRDSCNTFSSCCHFLGQASNDTACSVVLVQCMRQLCTNDRVPVN